MARLVAGLGNPDEKYDFTRHNIGFMVIDALTEEFGISLASKFHGLTGHADIFGERTYFLKPMTYMNLSGKSAGALASFYKIAPEDIFIIHDEMNIPFGSLKIRRDGSAGGHNGLSSLIEAIGTGFPRLKMGIGKGKSDSVSHVLGKFTPEEAKAIPDFISKGKEAVLSVLKDGLSTAMNVYNRSE